LCRKLMRNLLRRQINFPLKKNNKYMRYILKVFMRNVLCVLLQYIYVDIYLVLNIWRVFAYFMLECKFLKVSVDFFVVSGINFRYLKFFCHSGIYGINFWIQSNYLID
jgi:hypothetical protein